MRQYFVYMLLCADGKYYVGVTNNVERRFAEHQEGQDTTAWTYCRRPLKLAFVQEFQWIQDAIAFEKQLKGWSAKKKKALCEENFEALSRFAQCRNATRYDRPDRQPNSLQN